MEIKDLKEGEIYLVTFSENKEGMIFKYDRTFRKDHSKIPHISVTFNIYSISDICTGDNDFQYKEVDLETKHWLNECIKADKFITKTEAMQSFNQELTFLPEKWQLKITEESLSFINKYRKLRNRIPLSFSDSYTYITESGGANINYENHYPKITLDQFKRWVLKENNEVPEYVECLESYPGSYTRGKVYQVKRIQDNMYYTELDDSNSTTNGWSKDKFKISTTEAYNAQFKPKETVMSKKEEKWKVGGWVKVINMGNNWNHVTKNHYYQIINKDSGNKWVDIKAENNNQRTCTTNKECVWVGMQKPTWYEEQLDIAKERITKLELVDPLSDRIKAKYILGIDSYEESPKQNDYIITTGKKIIQVEVLPLQKPMLISTKKNKFKLQIN